MPFASPREAREFIVGRIIAQAERSGVSLTEDERTILSFIVAGETGELPADVVERFQWQNDRTKFAVRIVRLLREAGDYDAEQAKKMGQPDPEVIWRDAFQALSRDDVNLVAAIDRALRPKPRK